MQFVVCRYKVPVSWGIACYTAEQIMKSKFCQWFLLSWNKNRIEGLSEGAIEAWFHMNISKFFFLDKNEMKSQKYHIVGTIQKFNREVIERGKTDTINTYT